MKVYQRLAGNFVAEGVTHVFGIMGDGNMYWMHELDRLGGVKMLEVRHEGAGLGMADGWARVTRAPGIATATCGPGVTQLATALVTAARAGSPLVAFCGEHPTNDDEYNQRLDQARFAAGCESGFIRVNTPDGADDAVRKAFYLARLESRPVMLSAPMDVQQMAFDDGDEPYQPSSTLFSPRAVQPDPAALQQAADIIAGARKPVILVGRGAQWSGAGEAVLKLGDRIGALIATTLMAKTWLSEAEYHVGISGTYGTRTAMQLFEEADCVIAVGASMNRYTTEHGYLYPNARYVHLDSKPHLMMSGGRSADCYLQTDARAGVEALESLLARRSVKLTGYRTPEVKKRLPYQFEDRTEFPIEPGSVDPREICLALDEIVPADFGLFTGSGATAGFSNILFRRRRPVVLASHFFGCIGQMLPAAMGGVAATGNKPALLVDGDASIMMHLAEFETMVRYDMPLLVVCMNNQALGSEYYKLDAHKMKAELATIPTPDLGAVATAFGGRGRLVRSIGELRAAAGEWVARPGPMMLDVRISRSVVTLPYRRIHYGRDE
ncbi:MAG: thiamine pyrophosphate-binding protein [Betaproteobacteria bacterium]|nr:thiamine pyrophosphate-binding protein [Betaproteobacteria bacterium]MBI2508472.1 thiamine pyrophosphate-binding protein [Betaproteobacteria bacterium]